MQTQSQVFIDKTPTKEMIQFHIPSTYSQYVVLMDENTAEHCYPLVKDLLPSHQIIQVQSGEINKNLQTCAQIWKSLTDLGLDRKALVINLGGGVLGDMGGFCAATYKRGIDFIQMPTTLLSMVDASVGGKLGVDFETYKNHIGVFELPYKVLIFSDFIQTLVYEELRSGFAEVMKHCLIADAQAWHNLCADIKNWQNLDWSTIIKHSVEIKQKITQADPHEKGLRKILNFGHTIGHAIESYYLEKPGKRLLHGEAIGIGMICEAWLSVELGFISLEECESIKNVILSVYGKVELDKNAIDEMILIAYQDKKNEKSVLLFSLLKQIGEANFNIPVSEALIIKSFGYYID